MNSTGSIFRLMSDQMLIEMIQRLEQCIASFELTAEEENDLMASYQESLDLARAELERRRV